VTIFATDVQPQTAPRAAPAAHDAGKPAGEPRIEVEIAGPARLSALAAEVRDLMGRAAEPNVFMEPAFLGAASAVESVHVALAWDREPVPARLVGLWALTAGRPAKLPLPIRVLQPAAEAYSFLSTPVVDAARGEDVLGGMLDAIADSPLPKILSLPFMHEDGAVMAALRRALDRRAAPLCVLERSRRPMLASGLDGKTYLELALSASSRKKLRQHRRRLGEHGALARTVHADPQSVATALEDFLELEAAGWKGRRGTALLCHRSSATFARTAITALAAEGGALIDELRLDGRPVSMQIILRSGRAAFTWKTAFDERFHDYSPGMLLFEDYTQSLLAQRLAFVDSCAIDESGFMAAWMERRDLVHVWLDARPGGSAAFRLAATAARLYGRGRAAAKRLYERGNAYRKRRGRVNNLPLAKPVRDKRDRQPPADDA
jgi:CelD/BcsL family acetyltransferase involved in cellulose biosynthesis